MILKYDHTILIDMGTQTTQKNIKYVCECGSIIVNTRLNINRHLKTKKHSTYGTRLLEKEKRLKTKEVTIIKNHMYKRKFNLGTEESPFTVLKILPRLFSDILKDDYYECINTDLCIIQQTEVYNYAIETEYHIINIRIVDFGRYIDNLEKKHCERPDIVIFDDKSNIIYAIEITKTTFEESGNNAQYQRISKFSSFPEHIKKSIIFTGNDTIKCMNKKNNIRSLRMYKTCKIELYHISQNIQNFFNTIEPFSNIEDITEESKIIKKLNRKMSVIINGSIVHINNLIVYKSTNNGSHDPHIGKLIGILFCASVLCQNNENIKEIQITDCLRTSEMSKKNKLPLSILHISSLLLGKCRFRIINTEHFVKKIKDSIVSDLYILPNVLSTIHSRKCNSEKLVSIHEESLNRDNIVFTNHASSELSKFNSTIDWKKGLTPDLIIEHEDNYEIIEAELSKNFKDGIKQINSWITPENIIKWRTLYFKDKILHINIILYSPEPLMSYNFTGLQDNVKYILDSNNNKIVNLNYKPIIIL